MAIAHDIIKVLANIFDYNEASMPQYAAADLFNPGCPLVALGTSSNNNESLGEILKFGIQCGFRVLNMSDEDKNAHLIRLTLPSLIAGGFVTRQDLFISFKIAKLQNIRQLEGQIREHLKKRNLTYFDLLIVEHSSLIENDLFKVWKVLENLHLSRSVRNMGLSGFSIQQIKYILSVAVIKPFAVQALFNPLAVNLELIKFCQNHDLLLFAMSPLDHQKSNKRLQSESVVTRIAHDHSVSPVQILLAWAIQSQTLPVVQTSNIDHIKENIMLSDVKLSESEMEDINRLSGVS
ncbi:hypothetical protein ACHWQZ_G006211 [Mnemiopsis leidyi]